MNEYEKHLQNAERFLNSAVIYKENDCAVDAISRAYYACFHSILAYLYFRGKSKNLPTYIGHAELRSVYCDLYAIYSKSEDTRNLLAYVLPKNPSSVLKRWQRLRKDADYQRPWESFGQLNKREKLDFDFMLEFAKAHICLIENDTIKNDN